ncbi:hypothetical protein V3A08_07440 [Tenacibaculum maritimum]|uniref:hypothetical protein n=1 Tax=Tenacibaculum maritimum TaxID=107401 RepID=UPI003875B3E9
MMKRLMLEQSTSEVGNALGSSFNGGTGISIDIPDFNIGNGSTSSSSSAGLSTTTSEGGGFFSGFNLNGLLDTLLKGGMTWAQIEAAKNGKDVYVQGAGGAKENVTPILISKLQAQAAAQQTSVNQMMQIMQAQLDKDKNKPDKKDNTVLYIAGGVGFLLLVGIGIMAANSNKNKN